MTELEANGNFVRVKNNRGQRVYLTYVLRLLQGGPDKNGVEQPPLDSVTISAMGKAIPSAVNIAEIVKRRVVGLHQVVSISSETFMHTDEDAQDDAEGNRAGSRKASVITIQLSKQRLNIKDPGYQAPLPESMVTPEKPREERQRRPSQGAPRGGPRRGGNEGGHGGNRGGRGGNEGDRGGNRDGPRRGGRGGNRSGRGGNRGGRGSQ